MQTQEYSFHHSVAQKKGFALILTLSALAAIIALSGVLVSYLDVARKEAAVSKALIQANLYYADINTVFKGFKDRKTLYSVLYLSPVPLLSEDGRFSVMIACKPLANAVNINWLAYANDQNMSLQYTAAEKVFDVIAQEYDLEDAVKLHEMLLEEMQGKKGLVFKEQSRLRQKNGIISFKQFAAILDRYQLEADDGKIGLIPWKHFFVFHTASNDPEENLIDGNYMPAELLAVLLEVDIASVKEEWIPGSIDLASFSQKMGTSYEKKLFSNDFLARSRCEIQYEYEGERYAFIFEDIEGEIKNFGFLGKQ